MISILSVSWNCLDWMQLLVKSVRKFTTVPYEIVIIDNASSDGSVEWLREQGDIRTVILEHNIGHGRGLDMGLKQLKMRFCLVLDIDAHLQRQNWDFDLLELYDKNSDRRLIAAKGGEAKPIHPCFMFFETEYFKANNFSFVARDGYDVGRKIYDDILALNGEVFRAGVGYESQGKKFYDGAYGDEYYINQQILLYHNWYSSRMHDKTVVDNLTREEFEKRKKIVFEHPLVKDILA